MHNRGIAANWYAILGGRVGCKEEETRIEVDRKDGRLPWLCPGMTGRIPCIPRGHGHISHSSRFPSRQQPCVLPPPFLFDQRHHYLSYILPFFFFFLIRLFFIFLSASTIKSLFFFSPRVRLPFNNKYRIILRLAFSYNQTISLVFLYYIFITLRKLVS